MFGSADNVQVSQESGRLVVTHRWRGFRSLGVVIFAVVWSGMTIGFALMPAAPESDPAERLLLIPVLGVAAFALYLALATLFNRSQITLDADRLTVTHAPLPWLGRTFPRAPITGAEARRYQSGSSGQRRNSYAVVALFSDGKSARVVGDLNNEAQAQAIARALHGALSSRAAAG